MGKKQKYCEQEDGHGMACGKPATQKRHRYEDDSTETYRVCDKCADEYDREYGCR